MPPPTIGGHRPPSDAGNPESARRGAPKFVVWLLRSATAAESPAYPDAGEGAMDRSDPAYRSQADYSSALLRL